MPFESLKQNLAQQIAAALPEGVAKESSIVSALGSPPDPKLGHIALPCFGFAKKLGKNSNELALELCETLKQQGVDCRATGPYLNVRWNPSALYLNTLGAVFTEKENYGGDDWGKTKTVVIEYCSPNIAKKLAFHHIRSSLIGNVLANCYRFHQFKTERMNFVGDWGAQFARLLAAFELWGDREKLDAGDLPTSMKHLFDIYVRFHKELDTDASLSERASAALTDLESQKPSVVSIWKEIKAVSQKAMEATLKRLKVDFDHFEGESHYLSHIKDNLSAYKDKAGAELSDGAWIVRVEGIKTPALIQKTDGTTLYLTRDIAAAEDRYARFKFDQMLYVVSAQQSLHFQQLFGVLKKMGHPWADHCEHVSFGTVRFGSSKMSTREGKVVLLDDILDEAHRLALKVCSDKNPELENKEEVAEQVGVGAIIFGELSAHKQRDIDFSWDHVMAFDGETGPYVQYSLVRCYSLLEKAKSKGYTGPVLPQPDEAISLAPEEEALVIHLSKFRSTIRSVLGESEPFYLSRYLIDLAKHFNRFYYQLPVLQIADEKTRLVRLNLVSATQQVMENGLKLLGVECPKQM